MHRDAYGYKSFNRLHQDSPLNILISKLLTIMKMKKTWNKMNRCPLILTMVVLTFLFLHHGVLAQTTAGIKVPPPTNTWQEVSGDATSETPPFSPSIAAYESSGKKLLCAYTFINTSKNRTIAFTRSTDDGVTYSTITASLRTPTGYNCFDDPQLISIGGSKIICIVRAFSSTSGIIGRETSELTGSIPLESSILLYLSNDGGNTWGYYNGTGGAFDSLTSPYCILDYHAGAPTTDLTTLEWPRIAYRQGFDTKGYIVWTKKTWSATEWVSDNELRVSSSQIGIATFSATSDASSSTTDGKVFINGTGSDKFYYLSISGTNTMTDSWYTPGPERASVAVSPDSGIWLSYMKITYKDDEDGGQTWDGTLSPAMSVELVKLSSTIPSANHIAYTLGSPQIVSNTVRASGLYDKNRGFFYHPDFTDPDNVSPSVIDIASGPSVQVAMNDPLSCRSYNVGLLFLDGQDYEGGTLTGMSATSPINRLWFYSAKIKAREDVSQWSTNLSIESGTIVTSRLIDANQASDGDGSYFTTRFFPVLKYANVADLYLTKKIFDRSQNDELSKDNINSLPRSYFVAGYMRAYRNTASTVGPATPFTIVGQSPQFIEAKCKVAVFFDNLTATITNSSGAVNFIKEAENPPTGAKQFIVSYWGNKMDVDASYMGSSNNFEVHPVWRAIKDNSIAGQAIIIQVME
jgi:hypothetical protein